MNIKEIAQESYYHEKNGILLKGDCLEWMAKFPDKSIDMILADLPYGTTSCKWDSIIPFEPLWDQYERIIVDNGAIVLTASQPFTTELIHSNLNLFKYELIWQKSNPSNISQANRCPLKYHENIAIFYKSPPTYNKQMIERMDSGKKVVSDYKNKNQTFKHGATEHNNKTETTEYSADRYDVDLKNPSSIIYFKSERCHPRLHPTQKPVPLFEYLIKTYSNENEIILDNTAGVCTTAIACKNTNRKWICIEKEQKYCDISVERIKNHIIAP